MKKLKLGIVTTFPPSASSLNEYAFHFVRAMGQKIDDLSEIVLFVERLDGASYAAPTGCQVPVRFVPCWQFGKLSNPLRIVQHVRGERPDFVLFNLQFATFGKGKVAAAVGLTAPLLVKQAGFATGILLHNLVETVDLQSAGFAGNRLAAIVLEKCGSLLTRLLLTADFVAVTIPAYVEILEAKYGSDNVQLIPHGAFESAREPTFDLPAGARQIMTFGKFGTYKRIESLIEAFAKLQQREHEIELVVAGSDSPNAAGYLQSMQRQYSDLTNVRYTGYVAEEDVPQLFSDSAVVVFPYTSTTGSSGVLHQAGEFGRATVLPNIGDFAEVITAEGYDGEFFELGDVDSLAAALERLLRDDERRLAIGRTNYQAATSLPLVDVADWYLLHMQRVTATVVAPESRQLLPNDLCLA